MGVGEWFSPIFLNHLFITSHNGLASSILCKPRCITLLPMDNSPPIDRISNLPDELLSHILSFLPTKFAFTTTVLSKTWSQLFKLLTTLHLDDESVRNKKSLRSFRRFVDKVILSSQLIKTFHLKFNSRHHNGFNRWIKTLKSYHPVENLHVLSTFHDDEITLPPSIFKFPTLVVLKLMRINVVGDISVNLPSLKTLHLDQLYLKNHENFNKLLNGCPILEDLIANIGYIEEAKGFRVSTNEFKPLSKLIIADIFECDVPFIAISNIEILKLTIMGIRLPEPEINSYFRGFLVCQNLIHLELCFYHFHQWDNVVELLQNCPKLQILSFDKWLRSYNKDLHSNWKDPNVVPNCISYQLKSCIINYNGKEDELQFATYILQNAPRLEIMKIITGTYSPLKNPKTLEKLTFFQGFLPSVNF